MKSKGKRIINNSIYNRTQILIQDPEFKKSIIKLKKGFTQLGCPIPKGGFKTEKEFEKWKDKYFKLRQDKTKHVEFYQGVFDEILKQNNLDLKNKTYRDFLISYLFFNKKEIESVRAYVKVTLNKKSKEEELYIRILPNTILDDIKKIWPIINKEKQIVFKSQRLKPKIWERRKMDIDIYNTWNKFKKIKLSERKKVYGPDARLEILVQRELGGKYGKLSFESIRQSVNRVKKHKKVTDKKS